MTIDLQFASFFSMIFAGMYLGCMFDTNERMIENLKGKGVTSFVLQFFFWLLQSYLLFYLLIKINGGQVRLYFILAIVIGFYIYFFSLRKIYRRLLEKVIYILSKLISIIWRLFNLLLIQPIVMIGRLLFYGFNLMMLFIFQLIYLSLNFLKWLLSPVLSLIPQNVKKYLHSPAGIYSKIENIVINRKKV